MDIAKAGTQVIPRTYTISIFSVNSALSGRVSSSIQFARAPCEHVIWPQSWFPEDGNFYSTHFNLRASRNQFWSVFQVRLGAVARFHQPFLFCIASSGWHMIG